MQEVYGNHQNNRWVNLALLHQHCHDQIHQGMRDKHQVVEEPDEVTSLTSGFADESPW
jgi:hypothetical protein